MAAMMTLLWSETMILSRTISLVLFLFSQLSYSLNWLLKHQPSLFSFKEKAGEKGDVVAFGSLT